MTSLFSPLSITQSTATLKNHLKQNGFVVFDNPWGDQWVQGLQKLTQATPVIQTNGKMIYPITANPSATGKSDAQSVGIGLLVHSEWSYKTLPPKYLCLLCQTPDRWGGGATTVLNFPPLLHHFTLAEQEYMAHKSQYFMSKDETEGIYAPIWHPNTQILRFSYNVLIHKEFSPNLDKPVSKNGDRTLKALCDKILELYEAYHVPIHLKAGQILIMDNHICLHSRQAYRDPNRYLERIMLSSC